MNYKITDLGIIQFNSMGLHRKLLIHEDYRDLPFLAKILYMLLSKHQHRSRNNDITIKKSKLAIELGESEDTINHYLELLEDKDLIITAGEKIAFLKQSDLSENGIYKFPSFIQKDVFDDLDWYAKTLYAMYRNRFVFAIKQDRGNSNFYTEDNVFYAVYSINDIINELEIDEKTINQYNEQLMHHRLLDIITTVKGYQRFYTFDVTGVPIKSNTKTLHFDKQKLIKNMPPKIASAFQTMDIEHIETIQHAMRSYVAYHNINDVNRYYRKHQDVISKIIHAIHSVGNSYKREVYTKENLCFYVFNNEMKQYCESPTHYYIDTKRIEFNIETFHEIMSSLLSDYEIAQDDTDKIKDLQQSLPEFHETTIDILRLFNFHEAMILGRELQSAIDLINNFNDESWSDNFIDYNNNVASINIAILEIKGLLKLTELKFAHISPLLNHIFMERFDNNYDWKTTDIGIDIESLYDDLNEKFSDYKGANELGLMVELLSELNDYTKTDKTASLQRVFNTFAGYYNSMLPRKLENYILSLSISDAIDVFKAFSFGMATYTKSIQSKLYAIPINLSSFEERLLRCIDIILYIKHNNKEDLSVKQLEYITVKELDKSYQEHHQYIYEKEHKEFIKKAAKVYLEELSE